MDGPLKNIPLCPVVIVRGCVPSKRKNGTRNVSIAKFIAQSIVHIGQLIVVAGIGIRATKHGRDSGTNAIFTHSVKHRVFVAIVTRLTWDLARAVVCVGQSVVIARIGIGASKNGRQAEGVFDAVSVVCLDHLEEDGTRRIKRSISPVHTTLRRPVGPVQSITVGVFNHHGVASLREALLKHHRVLCSFISPWGHRSHNLSTIQHEFPSNILRPAIGQNAELKIDAWKVT